MDEKKNWAIEKAIELTRSALESPTGTIDDMLRPEQAADGPGHDVREDR